MSHVAQKEKNLLEKTFLKDIMHAPPIVLNMYDEFYMVEKTLREHKIKHLPVVDDDDKLVGVITLSDLYRTCAPRKDYEDGSFFYLKEQLNTYILSHVMSKNPRCLKKDDTLYDAMLVMVSGGYGCVMITDEKKHIEGIITQTDIVRVVTQLLGGQNRESRG